MKGQPKEPAALPSTGPETQAMPVEVPQPLPAAATAAQPEAAAAELPVPPVVAAESERPLPAAVSAPKGAAASRQDQPEEPQAIAASLETAEGQEAHEVAEAETLAFRLGSEEYLVPVGQVKEVLTLREATPVPHAPEYVPGVVSLRGTVLPVIDLAKRLGMAGGSRDDKSRIIVVGLDDEDAGLIVDRVRGVVRFPSDAVQPAPETLEQGAEFLKGIVRKEGKLYILLDLEKAVGV